MTFAQQLKEQGIQQGTQQGMQQGMQQEKRLIAQRLLAMEIDLQTIVRSTGLTLEEIQDLAASNA